ncbi:MAG: hypothetical protein IT437_10415 [Phycisphaerales bacterium]|nr:hypothetical protein [Phycisphaerales bacterium]
MNWVVYAVAAWVVMGLEYSLKHAPLSLTFGSVTLAPSFALVLMVWVALFAPPAQALWSALILGLLMDFISRLMLESGGTATLVGPMALAFLAGGRFVLASRWVMLRRNPVALGLMTVGAGFLVTIISAVPLAIHRVYGDPIFWHAWSYVLSGFGSAFYSGLLALPMALILNPASGAFGLDAARPAGPRRF